MKNSILLLSLIVLVSFSPMTFASFDSLDASDSIEEAQLPNLNELLDKAEAAALPEGRRVLTQALMISYAGGNQSLPARYKIYDLSSVYNILRPKL